MARCNNGNYYGSFPIAEIISNGYHDGYRGDRGDCCFGNPFYYDDRYRNHNEHHHHEKRRDRIVRFYELEEHFDEEDDHDDCCRRCRRY